MACEGRYVSLERPADSLATKSGCNVCYLSKFNELLRALRCFFLFFEHDVLDLLEISDGEKRNNRPPIGIPDYDSGKVGLQLIDAAVFFA